MTQLMTERLILRAPTIDDLDDLCDFYQTEESHNVSGPKPRHAVAEKLFGIIGQWATYGFGRYILVRRDTEQSIGHAGFINLLPEQPPELGWCLWSKDSYGQGFMIEAMQSIIANSNIKAPCAHILIDRTNHRSIHLAHRLGATKVENPSLDMLYGQPEYTLFSLPLDGRAA